MVLVGREAERAFCEAWAAKVLGSGRGGSLYVSGTPGSGKTATLTAVAEGLEAAGSVLYRRLNCMSVTPPRSLFARLLQLLPTDGHGDEEDAENSPPKRSRSSRASAKAPTRASTRGKAAVAGGSSDEGRLVAAVGRLDKPLLLVLDEMDQLMETEPEVLYAAFALPAKPRLRLLLIGIANQLDLTERFLPKLKVHAAKAALPKTLSFAPYTAAQLSAILRAGGSGAAGEAEKAGDWETGRELLSRKISAGDGDVRKALAVWGSVGRRGREGQGSAVKTVLSELRATTASPVARARLTAEQKLLLGAALGLRRRGYAGFSLRELETEWRSVAQRLGREAGDEAGEVAGLLEAQGLLEPSTPRASKKAPSMARDKTYRLLVDEAEAANLLQDDRLISALIPANNANTQSPSIKLPLKPRARKTLF